MANPFATGEVFRFGNRTIRPCALATDGRIRMVKGFNAAQCQAARQVPGLQVTVLQAIERRLRELAKERVRGCTSKPQEISS